MNRSKIEYESLGQALRRHFDTINIKRRQQREKEFSQRQAAKKIGVSPEIFKRWLSNPDPGNIMTSNLRLLLSFILEEGRFEDRYKEEQMAAFWSVATTRCAPDEVWIKEELLKHQPNKASGQLEN